MTASLIWITPDAERLIAHIARVSNPANQDNPDYERLLRYLIEHRHWSPLEMASACIEINTTRDIGRQILRHRSFSFQEFSQRYADVSQLPPAELREARLQDTKNRQNSFELGPGPLADRWEILQHEVYDAALDRYKEALEIGIAKEQARALLPEGLTPSRMYMAGTLRSWLHYVALRTGPETQKEHRQIAQKIADLLRAEIPTIMRAADL
jgi:thymidylate synthase (FAD)